MNEERTQRDFRKICIAHEFAGKGGWYARCYGDGIFQTITTRNRSILSPDSPYYTDSHSAENGIMVGAWSLYSNLDEFLFAPDGRGGLFAAGELTKAGENHDEFMGFSDDFRTMERYGFPFLDAMTTQAAFIKHISTARAHNKDAIRYYETSFCGPFLICGQYAAAFWLIAGRAMQNWDAFRSNHRSLKESGNLAEYIRAEDAQAAALEPERKLWFSILFQRNDEIRQYFRDNFERNMTYVKKYNIPLAKNFSPLPLDFSSVFVGDQLVQVADQFG